MPDTALGLSPAHWSAIGAFIAIISLIYIIWWNQKRDRGGQYKQKGKAVDKTDEKVKAKLARERAKLEKQKMRELKQELKKIKRDEIKIIEDECKITSGKPHFKYLGELDEGIAIEGSFHDTLGELFSYYLLDEVKKKLYKRKSEIKNPIKSGTDKNKFTMKTRIPRDNKYYLLLTTRASVNPRNVHYKIKLILKED